MEYLKLNGGAVEKYPYSIRQLKLDNKNTSFPLIPSDELLSEWGVFPVTTAQVPAYDQLLQTAKKEAPQNVSGAWLVSWVVENLPQEVAEKNIREKRNKVLSECDWTQVSDAPVGQSAWSVYRQALRDLPSQPGFPYNVIWPTPPA